MEWFQTPSAGFINLLHLDDATDVQFFSVDLGIPLIFTNFQHSTVNDPLPAKSEN